MSEFPKNNTSDLQSPNGLVHCYAFIQYQIQHKNRIVKTVSVCSALISLILADGKTSNVIRKLNVRINPYHLCEVIPPKRNETKSILCAGGVPGESVCVGDSGGPLTTVYVWVGTYLFSWGTIWPNTIIVLKAFLDSLGIHHGFTVNGSSWTLWNFFFETCQRLNRKRYLVFFHIWLYLKKIQDGTWGGGNCPLLPLVSNSGRYLLTQRWWFIWYFVGER